MPRFDGISTILGYLMPTFIYTYVLMISKHILVIFLNEPELFYLHLVKGFMYFCVTQLILFTINHLFEHS